VVVFAVFFATIIGCEADTPNYNQYAHVLAIDRSPISYDSATAAILLSPVRADVVVKQLPASQLRDSAVIFTYAHGLVADSLHFNMRNTYYELNDTVFFHYDQAVDSLGMQPSNPALWDAYRLDSVVIYLPTTNPPKVLTSVK
jgi:hypothetical protein